ncbi:MAG TPA: hypothetical protein VL988_13620, partial [Solirubrobacteraceae bacterium]|nr:hypothetical protein [Solirubrobacteraceae bacterium]
TTLTAIYVGELEVAIAHVGDSRAYCLRGGELLRLTDDHSLVDELMRQGRLTPEEAVEHPQRSVITRALGPEVAVEVDTRSFRARAGDVYLLCSDGLTSMVSEADVADILRTHTSLREAGEALLAAANEAGGRDNITVVLLRLEDLEAPSAAPPTEEARAVAPGEAPAPGATSGDGGQTAAPPAAGTASALAEAPPQQVLRRRPRAPGSDAGSAKRRRRGLRRTGTAVVALTLLALIAAGAYIALQSVYFIGTNDRGLVTMFRGVPYKLPGDLALYSSDYVSGVSASALAPQRRRTLLDHSLRSEANAAALIHSLELGQLE